MPFQIVTHEEHGDGGRIVMKPTVHPVVREGDMVYMSKAADLQELLNLKVYHTPHSGRRGKKGAGGAQKRLVGEQFMQESTKRKVVKKAKAKDILNTESTVSDAQGRRKIISLLRKIRKMKVEKHSQQGYAKAIIERLQHTSDAPKLIAAGKALLEDLPERSLEETLAWAIEYVHEHASHLSQSLFSVTEEVAKYATWKESVLLVSSRIKIHKDAATESVGPVDRKGRGPSYKESPSEVPGLDSSRPLTQPKNVTDKALSTERSLTLAEQLNRMDAIGASRCREAMAQQETQPTSAAQSIPRHIGSSSSRGHRAIITEKDRSGPPHRRLVTPEASTLSATAASVATSVRPHMPAVAAPVLRPHSSYDDNAVESATKRPLSTSQPTRPAPAPPSARPAPRKRSTTADPRSRTYTTGQHGDDEAIVLKMGQKDMTLAEDPPLVGEEEAGRIDADNQSRASTDFGSVQFLQKGERAADRAVAYHNIKQGEDIWNSSDLYRYNPAFESNQIHPVAVDMYKKRSDVRDKEVERNSVEMETVTTKAEMVAEKLVVAWERFGRVYPREYHEMNVLIDGKDFDRPAIIKEMHRLFSMDGEDHRLGKRGQNAQVDIASMNRRVKHVLYCRKMDRVCEAMWFVSVLTRMRDHCRRTNHPMPISCFKFLAAVYMMIQYGFEVTQTLFYDIMEQTVEAQDHKEIVVHRSLRAIREHLQIDSEIFLDYLNSRSIQPCSELLAQVRQIRLARTRAERAANIKFAIEHDQLVSFSPRPPPGSVPRDVNSRKAHMALDVNLLPVNKSLALVKETSELNDYGETSNSLKTPRAPKRAQTDPRSRKASDVHPPTPSVSRRVHINTFPAGGVLWEDGDYDDELEDDCADDVVELRLPTKINRKHT